MEESSQGQTYNPVMLQTDLILISTNSVAGLLTQVLCDLWETQTNIRTPIRSTAVGLQTRTNRTRQRGICSSQHVSARSRGMEIGKHACPGWDLVVTDQDCSLSYSADCDFQLRGGVCPWPSLSGIYFASDASAEVTVWRRKDSYPGSTGHRHSSLQQLEWTIKITSM